MKQKTVREAIISVIRRIFPEYPVYGANTREPVTRPAFKAMLFPAGCGALCGGSRERSVDVDIYYYASDEHKARAELEEVAEALFTAFYAGFCVGDTELFPDDEISAEQADAGILAIQFGVTWIETLVDSGEPMEDLSINIEIENMEVLSDGSDDAEG